MSTAFRMIIAFAGLFLFVYGWVAQQWALTRYRAAISPGPWFYWRLRIAKRDWFASDDGYRMYQWAGWSTLIGGAIMLASWLL